MVCFLSGPHDNRVKVWRRCMTLMCDGRRGERGFLEPRYVFGSGNEAQRSVPNCVLELLVAVVWRNVCGTRICAVYLEVDCEGDGSVI